MDKEMKIALLALISLLALVAVWQPVISANNYGFSELAILGPAKTFSGYQMLPNRNITIGEPIFLFGFIANHEGKVEFYQFVVKLGNESTVIGNATSASAPIIYTNMIVLGDGQNYTFPMELRIHTIGQEERLIFELWMYSVSKRDFIYTGLWNELWLNVTGP
jgi:uncharacterized membrane protein